MSLPTNGASQMRRIALIVCQSLPLRKLLMIVGCGLAALLVSAAQAQAPSFTLSNNSPITIPSQQFGPLTVTVTPANGFSGELFFSCSGLPIYVTCNYPNSNTSLTVSGGSATETIVINTSQINNYETRLRPASSGLRRVALGALFGPAALLVLFGRKRRWSLPVTSRLALSLLMLLPLAGFAGCAAVRPNGTPAGTYTFQVVGTQNSLVASTTVTLKVT